MSKDIHPEFFETTIRCSSCGETFATKSTKKNEIVVDMCSKCHPFFTGGQTIVTTGGRIDRFNERIAKAKKHA